jgi:metallo-beta-lactamase class B
VQDIKSHRYRLFVVLLLSVLVGSLQAQESPQGPKPADTKPDSPEVQADIAKAKDIAGTVWPMEERYFCAVSGRLGKAADPGPQKLFDNLYAIPGTYGPANAVVYAITTSKGIILIDAGSMKDVETILLPGLKTLGLDPANVKLIIVTHGHADHYGASPYFQEHFGTHVALAAADWDLMKNPPPGGPPMTTPPKRDVVAVEGKPLKLGNEKVMPVYIPGHTPGSLGLIFPVKEGNKTHVVAIFGGAIGAFGTPEAQIRQYLQSVAHFEEWTKKMKVDVELQNHPMMDGFGDKLAQLRAGKAGDPNPFVVGRENYTKFLDVMSVCFEAALARRAGSPGAGQ